MARWKAETYPAIRAEAAQVGATIYFADEAGGRSVYHAGTTWAPVGQIPVVTATGDRFGINLISAVAAKGTLRFAAYEGSLNGPVFIDSPARSTTPKSPSTWPMPPTLGMG